MRNISFILLTLMLLCASSYVEAQDKKRKKDNIKKHIPTGKVSLKKDDNKRKNRPKRKVYKNIVKNKPKKTLYGNRCAIEVTRKMGFEYVVQVKEASGSLNELPRIWNNAKVKTGLVLTRSPFWKWILNSKFKKCRIKSGDKTG